ncbi:MAG: DinB family protein [Lutimonas sp.]
MLITVLKSVFNEDLNKLRSEIEHYKDEKNLWLIEHEIKNSAGNLCLHLIGNLNGLIGAVLGETGYIRQRDLEFSSKNIPKSELLLQIEETIAMVHSSLDKVKESELQDEYPLRVFPESHTKAYYLIHLATHLNYHLGQINYHRRLLDK